MVLSDAMIRRIRTMKARHDEIMDLLRGGGSDISTLGRELSSLSSLSSACDAVRELHDERRSLTDLLNETRLENGGNESLEMIDEIERELGMLDDRSRILSR